MNSDSTPLRQGGHSVTREPKLSYKFQRLRERLREAIVSGQLSGKLPGERALAKRFRVNAKTLGKALTDLSAEGLLERTIGRGTFVRGAAPDETAAGRWLILCDEGAGHDPVIGRLVQFNPSARVCDELSQLRPSFINQFSAVIDFSSCTPDEVLRDLMVRNMPVVAVNHEPRVYSTHAVLIDRAFGACVVARDLAVGGHQRIAVVERSGRDELVTAMRSVASRYGADIRVQPADLSDLPSMVEHGTTAVVCGCGESANRARGQLEHVGGHAAHWVSLAAVGPSSGEDSCTGYFVSPQQQAQTILHLLEKPRQHRPMTLWLVGAYADRGTVRPASPEHARVGRPVALGVQAMMS